MRLVMVRCALVFLFSSSCGRVPASRWCFLSVLQLLSVSSRRLSLAVRASIFQLPSLALHPSAVVLFAVASSLFSTVLASDVLSCVVEARVCKANRERAGAWQTQRRHRARVDRLNSPFHHAPLSSRLLPPPTTPLLSQTFNELAAHLYASPGRGRAQAQARAAGVFLVLDLVLCSLDSRTDRLDPPRAGHGARLRVVSRDWPVPWTYK